MVVTTARARRLALARDRAVASRKPGLGVPAYLRYVNRPAGAVVARHAFAADRTPDQLTVSGVVVAGAGLVAVVASVRWPWFSAFGGVLLLVAYVLDSADGQLARLRGGGSPAGEWLDHVVDIGKTSTVHAVGVVVVLARAPSVPPGWVAVPLVAGVVSATTFFALVLRDQLLRGRPAVTPPSDRGRLHALGTLLHDHALLCAVVATAGWADVFLTAYTAYAAVSAALLVRVARHARADLPRSSVPLRDRCTRSQS